MDEDNNNPPQSRPYRVRRPSSSLISSTTSPIFPVPPNPLLRSSINRVGGGSSSSSSMTAPGIQQQQSHHHRDLDEEPTSAISSSSSLSTSSFMAPSSRQRPGPSNNLNTNASTSSSSSNYANTRSSSPLGSPDSTFWGPSQSPGPVNSNLYRNAGGSSSSTISGNSNTNHSIAGPPTPGGLCVVSSSTVEDDIPPSPFSPASSAEDNNIGNVTAQNIRNNNSGSSNSVSVISGNSSNQESTANNQGASSAPGSSSVLHSSPLLQGSLARSSRLAAAAAVDRTSSEGPPTNGVAVESEGNGQYFNSNFSSPSSSLYLSPLSKKIKKASSFERFSAQAQASINSNAGNSGGAANNNGPPPAASRQEISVSRTPNRKYNLLQQLQSQPSTSTSSNAAIPGPSRLLLDYVQGESTTTANDATTTPEPIGASGPIGAGAIKPIASKHSSQETSTPSINNNATANNIPPLQFSSKPYHIKKYAAKIAVLEQSKFAADDSANSPQFPPLRSSINPVSADDALNTDNFLNDLHANSPLNLTDNSSTNANSAPLVRGPVQKSFSKRIPMPPKQKILQRMQSGEIFDGISPPPPAVPLQSSSGLASSAPLSPPSSSALRHSPPPLSSSQLQQQLQSQLIQQQQQDALHQQLLHESLQHQQQSTPMDSMSSLQQSSQSILDRYNSVSNYDALTRSNMVNSGGPDDFSNVQDVLSKSNMDCDPNIQVLYDDVADAYAYYYGLGDEIFSNAAGGGNSGGASSSGNARPLLVMPSGSNGGNMGLQDDMGNMFQSQSHGHLEFVLGNMNHGNAMVEDNEMQQHERILAASREMEDLQLGEVGIENGGGGIVPSQHVQFLDPNDVSSSLSKLPNDSTLRNLLMMQPLRSHDDSWIAANNEYQNSLRSLSAGSGLPTNSILGNALLMNNMGNNSGSGNSSTSGANWVNDWAARSLWQQQHVQHDQQTDDDSGGDQDEVMDMSIMEMDKSHNMNPTNSSSIIVKRSLHNQALLEHNGAENLSLDDVDLAPVASGANLPSLHGIPLDLQLQHIQQQPLGLNMFGKNSMMDSSGSHVASMDPQQHHRSGSADNDEPVNLIASTNSVQELMQQHQQHHHHHGSSSHHILNDGNTSCIVSTQDPNNSCMTILTTTSSTTVTSAGSNFGNNFDSILNNSNLTSEEKRIIHYKKSKDSESFNLARGGNSSVAPPSPPTANFIPDKPVQPKAFGSLPSPLSLARDEDNTWRVFNRHKTIPCNTRFGPVEGPMKKVYESDFHNMSASIYPYLVIVDESTVLLQLDRTLDEMCNWMKFVRLARTPEEQNALISESNNLIYFTTCRDILSKAELRVGYSFEYAQKFGFHYMEPITASPIPVPFNTSRDQDEGELEIEYEAPSILTVAKRQKGSSSKSTVVQYSCFECDAEFSNTEELRSHLNKVHDNEPDEMIRRPKKKVLKKYYNSENINPSVSPVPPSATRTSESKNSQPTKNPLDAKQSSSAVSSQNSANNAISGSNSSLIKEVTGSKYEKFPRKKAAMENALVQDSGNLENACSNNSSKAVVASSIITTTAAAVPVVVKKKYKCSICYKSFAAKDRLDKHFMAHCDEECKPLKCPTCYKRFLTNSALAGHIKTHSEDGKCFECPLCEFSTQQLLQLKEHVQTHRNPTTGFFHCHRCTKKFTVYAMVRKHIRAFHGPRTFQCDYEHCTMKFPTSDKLKLHKLKHSDHREFLCAECGHQFKRRDKLVEHTKRMHAEGKKKSVEVPILPLPPPTKKPRLHKKFIPKLSDDELGKFTYRCADCSIGFKRRGMLVNHLAKRHPEKTLQQVPELNLPIMKTTRNYFCLYCERVYKSSSKRKSHILKSHPGKQLPPQLRGKHTKTKAEEVKAEASKSSGQESFVSSDENGVSASGIQLKRMSLYDDADKVVATPHACEWCHRQYATRAKLLQHQRKNHLHLMPPDIQTPRAQKNNVRRNAENSNASSPNSSASPSPLTQQKLHIGTAGSSKEIPGPVIQFQHARSLVPESNDPTLSQVSGSDEVIGFFLTTNISNGDLNSILQQAPELVVVPMTSLPSTLNTEAIASITSTSGNNNLTLPPVAVAGNSSSSRAITSSIYSTETFSRDNSQQTSNNLNN